MPLRPIDFLSTFFLSLCIPFTTYAQHDSLRISLDELFARGAEQHLQLHADRLKEQMAEERIRDARTARMPDISIGLKGGVLGQPVVWQSGLNDPTRPDTPDWQQNYTVDFPQPLYQGGKIKYSIRKAGLEQDIARLQTATDRADIKLELLEQYLNLFSLYKQDRVLNRNIEESERRLKDIWRMKEEGIITNNEIIVTICYHSTEMIPDFIDHTRRKGIVVRNKFELILRLIYSSAVWFLKYLKQINNDVTAAEKELEKSIRNEDLLRLMKLQKTLVYFNTSIRGNEVMIGKLQSIFQEKDYQNPDLVEDVVIELKQAYNTVNIYSDILTGTMDAFASIISNNVNTIMKRMTSISIILMVPTLIASFYGMNVDVHVDELPHAFSLIILISIMLSAMAFVIFKKIKWF